MCVKGSPPRGRGKGKNTDRAGRTPRITPAWAGKRTQDSTRTTLPQDHPRMGGEKHHSPQAVAPFPGSPRRGRGKVLVDSEIRPLHRITPAQTGKGRCSSAKGKAVQDHPRMGEEKGVVPADITSRLGSPPRGRGKDSFIVHCHACVGITPAWAGKSPASQPWSPPLWMMVIRPRP